MTDTRPLVITMGEPSGIGPDTIIKAWHVLHENFDHSFVVIGDAEVIASRAVQMNEPLAIDHVQDIAAGPSSFRHALPVLHRPLTAQPRPGVIEQTNASRVTAFIEEAVDLALGGSCSGIVTAPIQKETLYGAGFQFEGHTDFLADLSVRRGHPALPVMMLVAPGLRTIPVTIHIPLKDVPHALTKRAIVEQAIIADNRLRQQFAIPSPRIGVTGLNPHAGEGGTIGTEEKTIIAPAIAELRSQGLNVSGPLPGDTAFHAEARSAYDVIICMYHDQALIPVKTIDFHGGVNVTLGLPFIRTSPDHGTALSLAGTGTANPQSLVAAIKLATSMANLSLP